MWRCKKKDCLGNGDEQRSDSATEILRQRFAKGEISKEEFEEKLQVLEGEKMEKGRIRKLA